MSSTWFLAASDALTPARNQMALSLGWHIILACFGMVFPAMIYVLHRRGIGGDADALELAKRWSKIAAVLFAVGAVSGTILSSFGLAVVLVVPPLVWLYVLADRNTVGVE